MPNLKCAHCGSFNTQTGVDKYHCLDCGNNTSYSTGKIDPAKRTEPVDLNEPLVQDYAPHGNPAGSSRTPDGVADPGTNISGPIPKDQGEAVRTGEQRDDDLMKGVPEPPPEKDDRPSSMQTDHRVNPDPELVDEEELAPDVHEHGGFKS